MKLTSLFFYASILFFINISSAYTQCNITNCANPAILSGNAVWTNGVQGASNGFLTINGITLGNVDCLTGDVGLEIYVYQLLPDGTRMSFCNLANVAPNNFIYKFPIGFGPLSDCSDTAFPIPDQIFYDHNNAGVDSGVYLCEGGVYEVVLVVYLNDTGADIPPEESVYTVLASNQYQELNIGSFFVNYTDEFATPNPFPIPISTAAITGPNGETTTMTTSCTEDLTLFIEALSYIGRCRVDRESVPNYYPFCDPLDPNMTGTYSGSIKSELENFLSYTVNGGPPVIIRDGNSGNAGTESYGGQQTGPGNLPGLGADECYTGLCGARPFPVPDSMCAGDVMVVTVETFDVYTNISVTDQMTVTFTGEGCNDCGPSCPTAANISPSADSLCGGDMLTITANTVGEGSANFTITESTGTIASITAGTAFGLPFNTTCAPVTYTFNLSATCADDGSIITAGTQSVEVTVYPTSINGFVTTVDGECSTNVSIDAACGTNVTVSPGASQSAEAGATGTHTYTVSWAGGGPNCISDFDVSANYNCPPDIVCPTSADISASISEACGGDMLTITANTVGEGSANFTITESTGIITAITAGTAFSLPFNTTCVPVTYTFNLSATCADDGSIIAAGTQSVEVTVYPTSINGFVTTADGECSTSVSIDAACGTNVTVSPGASQSAEAGTTGTHTYTVSWTGGGPICISDFDVSANYNCPPDIVCPTSADISASISEACGGDMLTITANTAGEGNADFTITESTGTIASITAETAFSLPFNTTCVPVTYTFNLSATCADDGSIIAAGTQSVEVTVYPTSINGFVTTADGECSTSVSIDAACGTNVTVSPGASQSAEAGTTGTHTYTVSWTGGGPICISDFDVSANYNCPPDIVCPTSADISASISEACGGDMLTITANTAGEGSANFTITESTGTIASITAGTAFGLPFNTTCLPVTYTFNLSATCADDGSIITAGTQSVEVTVYPTSINGFVTTADGECSTSVSIDATCGTNVTVSPGTSQSAEAGVTGTHTYTVSWAGGGPNCISDFDVNANYNCPAICPDDANIAASISAVCGGDMLTITGTSAGNGNASYIITESTGVITNIAVDSPFAIPENNTCSPVTYTFNAVATCDADGSEITNGNFSLDIVAYPNNISSLINTIENGCTTEIVIDNSCDGSVLVEPALSQTAVLGEQAGTHQYTVSWIGDDFNCIAAQDVSLNYNCFCEFDPTRASVEKFGGSEALNKVCYGDTIFYNALYEDLIIDLDDGGIDNEYEAAFVIFIEPIDFVVPPVTDQIQRITNDTLIINDGSLPPGNYYLHYFQSRDVLDPALDMGSCTETSRQFIEIAILQELTVEATTCSGFENNNEIVITIIGGDNNTPPTEVYLDSNGTQFSPNSIETVNESTRVITFNNLPDGDYMFFYEDASACTKSVLLAFNCSSAEFDCPSEISLPIAEGCAGETSNLAANIIGASEFTTITWTDALGNIISDPENIILPENNTCAPILTSYTIEVNCTQNPDFVPLTATQVFTVYPNDVAAFVTPVESQCETLLAIDASCGDLISYQPVSFGPGESGTVDLTINYESDCVSPFMVSVNYNCPAAMGCTDPCAPNYNAAAMQDDGSCEPYNNTCNQDCTNGAFGGTWDATTCSCINEITPVNGCTDVTACNYDSNANCDDANCDFGNTACVDPCNEPDPNDGCDLTDDSFDAATCTVTNTPNCPTGTSFDIGNCKCIMDAVDGCLDPCDPAYNPLSTNDNLCVGYSTDCNTDCLLGDLEVWDATTCACVVDVLIVTGCTEATACNYDATANCDDGNCDSGNTACTDPCNEPNPDDGCDLTDDSFDAATCTVTNTPNCPTGTSFDIGNCECIMDAVDGCLDPCDPAYNPLSTNDNLCVGYSTDCNTDCLLGNLEVWDATTCACVVDVLIVTGCTEATACNYNASANCDDGNCDFGNTACVDPCNEPNPDDGCDITSDSFDAATCTVTNEPDCPATTEFEPSTCECLFIDIDGCTDFCASNYNPLAMADDGTCEPYNNTCNEDCTAGDFGGTWNPSTCSCINEITPVSGCTDATACNFDSNANCDDGNCEFGNIACTDPCNEPNLDDGCDITTDSFDAATCTVTNEPNCPANTTFNANTCNCDNEVIMGCTDACAPNFNALANEDDGSCEPYNNTCNQDCAAGVFGGTWDVATCSCINENTPVGGCTDATACNFDSNANCDDDSCEFGNIACIDPCNEPNPDDGCDFTTDSFDTTTCTISNTPNCEEGETFLAESCECLKSSFPGCTDPCALNFDSNAFNNDDECFYPDPDDGCDITTDSYDNVNCEIINEPVCPAGTTFNALTCNCDDNEECSPPTPGTFECDE